MRLQIAEQGGARGCPYCHAPIVEGDRAWDCPACGTRHHRDCAFTNGRCTVLGCTGIPEPVMVATKPEVADRFPSQAPTTPVSPRKLLGPALLGLGMIGLVLLADLLPEQARIPASTFWLASFGAVDAVCWVLFLRAFARERRSFAPDRAYRDRYARLGRGSRHRSLDSSEETGAR
jgi:hypothetical protein